MLSYEHVYHAGNHADILKHSIFTLILQHLKKKQTPFTVIDTHAGLGVYSLTDERALKIGENAGGIERYLSIIDDADFSLPYQKAFDTLKPFTNICDCYHKKGLYAGSPEIARCMMRKNDSLILSELHPQGIEALRENMKQKPLFKADNADEGVKPHIHYRSGFELLAGLKPPARGVVLVDPSYEELSDFTDAAGAICTLYSKWKGGIFALWYPLTVSKGFPCSRMRQSIISSIQNMAPEGRILDVQLSVTPPDSLEGKAALYGSGMLIVNYPYKLDQEIECCMPYFERVLCNQNGKSLIKRY